MLAPTGRGGEGGDGGIPSEFGPYLVRLRQRIQEALNYPTTARRRGLAGTVQLEIDLLPSGKVASVIVRSSSSHAVLDEAALDTVRRLSPDPFPPGLQSRPLRIRLPIVFELQ
jgi:protein TonB